MNDWNRDWDRRNKRYWKRLQRRYNAPYYNTWWYPYWNQWIAPVINPIVQTFWPYPVVTPGVGYPYQQPTYNIPPVYYP
jgi:hypothetical protein